MRVKENIQKSRTPFYKIIHDSPLAPQHLNSLHSFANPRWKIKLVDVIQTTTIKTTTATASDWSKKKKKRNERTSRTDLDVLSHYYIWKTHHPPLSAIIKIAVYPSYPTTACYTYSIYMRTHIYHIYVCTIYIRPPIMYRIAIILVPIQQKL